MTGNIVRVEHWNGTVIRGLITGGDGHGLYVQPPRKLPVFCDFQNVKTMSFGPAA